MSNFGDKLRMSMPTIHVPPQCSGEFLPPEDCGSETWGPVLEAIGNDIALPRHVKPSKLAEVFTSSDEAIPPQLVTLGTFYFKLTRHFHDENDYSAWARGASTEMKSPDSDVPGNCWTCPNFIPGDTKWGGVWGGNSPTIVHPRTDETRVQIMPSKNLVN